MPQFKVYLAQFVTVNLEADSFQAAENKALTEHPGMALDSEVVTIIDGEEYTKTEAQEEGLAVT